MYTVIGRVSSRWLLMSVCSSICWSVCHNYLKGEGNFLVNDLITPTPSPLGVKNMKILKKIKGLPGVPYGPYTTLLGSLKMVKIWWICLKGEWKIFKNCLLSRGARPLNLPSRGARPPSLFGLPNSSQLHCDGVGGKVMEKVGIWPLSQVFCPFNGQIGHIVAVVALAMTDW